MKGINGLQRAVAQIALAYAATGHVPTQPVGVSLAYEGTDRIGPATDLRSTYHSIIGLRTPSP